MDVEKHPEALARVYAAGLSVTLAPVDPDSVEQLRAYYELCETVASRNTRLFVNLMDTLADEQRAKVGVTKA